jgi:hypothetical protein
MGKIIPVRSNTNDAELGQKSRHVRFTALSC